MSDEVVLVAEADIDRLQDVAKRAGEQLAALRSRLEVAEGLLREDHEVCGGGCSCMPAFLERPAYKCWNCRRDAFLTTRSPSSEGRDPVEAVLAVKCPEGCNRYYDGPCNMDNDGRFGEDEPMDFHASRIRAALTHHTATSEPRKETP